MKPFLLICLLLVCAYNSNAQLSITDFNPKSVRGGVGDTIIIDGNNFGTTRGHIKTRDANNHSDFTLLDDIDIVQWTNTRIIIRIPSLIVNAPIVPRPIPGTGPIRIINSNFTDSAQTTQYIPLLPEIIQVRLC